MSLLLTKSKTICVPFDRVLEEERAALEKIQEIRGESKKKGERQKRFNLAFSGGGIRSATFNLGVLQALAEKGVLSSVDYLSSVSGGGYINSWLTAWNRRVPFKEVKKNADIIGGSEPNEIRHLRKYSNYLTPRVGFLSADTWTMVATYTRNLMLNLLIITLSLCGVLLVPRVLLYILDLLAIQHFGWFLSAFLVLVVAAVAVISYNLIFIDAAEIQIKGHKFLEKLRQQGWIQTLVVTPVFLSSILISLWVKMTASHPLPSLHRAALRGLVLYFIVWMFGWLIYKALIKPKNVGYIRETIKTIGGSTLVLLCTGLLGGVLYYYVAVPVLRNLISDSCLYYLLAPVIICFLFSLVLVLHIGFARDGFTDEMREWWSRLGAWLSIYCIGWLGLWLSAFQLPSLLEYLSESRWVESAGILGWLATTLGGILAGKSSDTNGLASKSVIKVFVRIAPWIFAVGFVSLVSWIVTCVFFSQTGIKLFGVGFPSTYYYAFFSTALMIGAYILAKRIDVNEFSMHAMYRNRLVRCYLGASNQKRREHPFTGLDRTDDISLAHILDDCKYGGPFPIFNTTLNIAATDRLDWQTRKARPFYFTPLSFGYEGKNIRFADWRQGTNVTVGSCMAISGAALSPSMGFHTSSAVSFLMTIFNVRLGQWFFNPNRLKPNDDLPRLSLFYLLKELFGLTTDTSKYVYLSDGGHFENLGLYELVRRECDNIIISDASEDGDYTFTELGNAIEKCHVDLGAEIKINGLASLKPGKETGTSKKQVARGTITYRTGTGEVKKTGTIIYLKASISGKEPEDILAYKAKHKTFPHQSTADQWFDEPQFEAHRALGYWVGKKCLG